MKNIFFWYLQIVQNTVEVLYFKYANHNLNLANRSPTRLGISLALAALLGGSGLQEARLCPWVYICRGSPWGSCLREVTENQSELDTEAPAWVLQAQICFGGHVSS